LQPVLETTGSPAPQEAAHLPKASVRNVAIDAYRGLVMVLMMAEVLHLAQVARAFPGNWFWAVLGYNQSHVEWAGFSLHDLIQPSFTFLVGVAMPYSIASRLARGKKFGELFGHAIWRAFLLIILGIFLRSMTSTQTNFTFEDTLTQIGLGYPILFLLGFRSPRWAWGALGAILFGYWLAWALYPAPGLNFNYQAVGVPADWTHNFAGFASHWNKNSNLGIAFDQWFLNLFPRQTPWVYNGGGYLTLSFIPTLGTMILGLAAGRWLRGFAPRIPMKRLLIAGVIGIAAGALLHVTGICPVVKRIWTPSWTLFSGGICFLFLAAFCWIIELKGYKKWAFPLVVVGMNSIAAYVLADGFGRFVVNTLHIHLGHRVFQIFGTALEPFTTGVVILLIYWAVLYRMYQRKLFLKI
jgi:predicted acyltransferase